MADQMNDVTDLLGEEPAPQAQEEMVDVTDLLGDEPAPQPQEEMVDVSDLLGDEDVDPMTHPLWRVVNDRFKNMSQKDRARLLKEIDKRDVDAQRLLNLVEKPELISPLKAGLSTPEAAAKYAFTSTADTITGTLAEVAAKTFSSASTEPSKFIDWVQAMRNKNGEKDPSLLATLGSTIRVVEGLNPFTDGETAAQAISAFTPFDREDARTKVKRIYSTPVISETGRINKEALDYSDIPRYLQNEMAAAWAEQRTGIASRELWLNVIASRGGVLSRDAGPEAGLKRAGQVLDNAAFNIPSWAYQKASMGETLDKTQAEQYPNLANALAMNASIKPEIVQGEHGKWYAKLFTGFDKKTLEPHEAEYVEIEGFDPNASYMDRMKAAKSAIFKDTVKQLNYQAMEPWSQILDPTLLFGTGIIKGIATGTGKVAKALGGAARVVEAVSPFSQNAGAFATAARVVDTSRTLGKIPGVNAGARAVGNVVRSDTTLGTITRATDKILTSAALYGGLSALGAPEGGKYDAAIISGLLSVGMSPLHVMTSRKPEAGVFDSVNRNALKEIIATEDPKNLSNYSKRFLEREMKQNGVPDYATYRNNLNYMVDQQKILDPYRRLMQETAVTSDMVTELQVHLGNNPEFQKLADTVSALQDNRGVNVFGRHSRAAINKVIREGEDHAKKVQEDITRNARVGSASAVPQGVLSKHTLDGMKKVLQEIPSGVLNSKDNMARWLNDEIAGGNSPEFQNMRIGRDAAEAIQAQVSAIPLNKIYEPYAAISIIVNAALDTRAKELGNVPNGATRAGAMSDAFEAFGELHDHYANMSKDDLHAMFADLTGIVSNIEGGESAVGLALRRMGKPEQEDVSPAAAARVIEQDVLEKMKNFPQQVKEIAFLRKQAGEAKDPGAAAVLNARAEALEKQVQDSRGSTYLAGFHRWARDTQKVVTDLRGKIRGELLKGAGIDEAISKTNVAAKKLKGATREKDLLIERSRLEGEKNTAALVDKREAAVLRKEILESSLASKASVAALRISNSVGGDIQKIEGILTGKIKDKLPPGLSKEEKRLVGWVRTTKQQLKEAERKIAVIDETIRTHTERTTATKTFAEDLLVQNITRDQAHEIGTAWFDKTMSGAIPTKLEETPFYQNLRTAILDDIYLARSDFAVDVLQGTTTNFITHIPPEHIAAVRLLGDEDWVRAIGGKPEDPSFQLVKRQSRNLADHLATISSQSRIARAAIESVDNQFKNPDTGSIAQLMKDLRVLNESVFVRDLMDDAKKDVRSNGMMARLEEMVNRNTNGLLSKDDFVFLQTLTKDSAIGKGYRAHLESIGKDAPWMITYRQDVGNIIDAITKMSGDVVQKALKDTQEYFHQTGYLYNPSELDIKIAAGMLLTVGDTASIPRGRMADLFGIAQAWKERVSNYGEALQTGEALGVSLDRQLGKDVHLWQNQLFDAANVANNARAEFAREYIESIENIKVGRELYAAHMKPNSPVRNLILRSTVALPGHAATLTENIKFATSGYSVGMKDIQSSERKSGMTPAAVAEEGRTVVTYLTDHILVNGELTAFGKVYAEWVGSTKNADEFVKFIAPRIGAEGDKELQKFLTRQLEFYTKVSPDQFGLYKQVLAKMQEADRKGLEIVNQHNRRVNKDRGTNYADIRYEPWRLEAEVPTNARDLAMIDPTLLGSYRDADRIMGQRYSTTPENQITKAQATKIALEDIMYGPEEIAINRFTRLVNDVHARSARANLSRIAMGMEFTGYNEQATILRDYIIAPGTGLDKSPAIWDQLTKAVNDIPYVGATLNAMMLVSRQLYSPFIALASPIATAIEQPLQQSILQITNNPIKNLARAAVTTGTGIARGVTALPGAFFTSIFYPTQKLNVMLGGKTLKLEGPYAKINKEIYDGVTKRSDPYVEARLAEARRSGGNLVKAASRTMATAPLSPEAIAARMLFRIKEASENRGAIPLLQQAGAIFQLGMEKFQSEGRVGLHKHLGDFMVGPLTNNALLTELTRMVEAGDSEAAYKGFASYYVKQNIGNWNKSNIPKFWRQAARLVPGADSFYIAATLGAHRTAMSIVNTQGMTPKQKAYAVASVFATAGISSGLGAMSEETGVDWFNRLSPFRQIAWLASVAQGNFDVRALPESLQSIGTGMTFRMGPQQTTAYRSVIGMLEVIKTFVQLPDPTVKPDVKKDNIDRAVSKMRRLIMDQSFLRPIAAGVALKPSEISDMVGHIQTGLAIGVDPDDVALLEQTIKDSRLVAKDMLTRKELYEIEAGAPIDTFAEDATLKMMALFAEMGVKAQENIWADYGIGDLRTTSQAPMEEKLITAGMTKATPWAERYLSMLENIITRYEEDQKTRLNLISGATTEVQQDTPKR